MSNNPAPSAGTSSTPPPTQEGNSLAIASMVLGILSFVLCGPFCAIPAVITGHISLGKIRRGVMPAESHGYAVAGTVLGYINIALLVLAMLLMGAFIAIAASNPHMFN